MANNNGYINNITQNQAEIETELADFGYKSDKVNNKIPFKISVAGI
jgi:hypothetical protein